MAGEPAPDRIAAARRRLFEARERRVHPGLDDKVLASWNGLACRAFAEAGRALGRADYVAAAVRNAEFILGSMRRDGRLLRTWKADPAKKDGQAKLSAYLEDHAMVAMALLAVYEATFERRWLDEARALAEAMLALFWDDALEGFYDTGVDHEALIVRPRNLQDNAVPCGSSVAIEVLLRLAVLLGERRYESIALKALRPMADLMSRYGAGFGRFLCALDFHLGPVVEVALIAPPGGDLVAAGRGSLPALSAQPRRGGCGGGRFSGGSGHSLAGGPRRRRRPADRLRLPQLRVRAARRRTPPRSVASSSHPRPEGRPLRSRRPPRPGGGEPRRLQGLTERARVESPRSSAGLARAILMCSNPWGVIGGAGLAPPDHR